MLIASHVRCALGCVPVEFARPFVDGRQREHDRAHICIKGVHHPSKRIRFATIKSLHRRGDARYGVMRKYSRVRVNLQDNSGIGEWLTKPVLGTERRNVQRQSRSATDASISSARQSVLHVGSRNR